MEPFRSVRGGGTRAWLAAAEASLLRSLVSQVMSLVEPYARRIVPGQPPIFLDRAAARQVLAGLVRMVGPGMSHDLVVQRTRDGEHDQSAYEDPPPREPKGRRRCLD